jgi:hypothetical protein
MPKGTKKKPQLVTVTLTVDELVSLQASAQFVIEKVSNLGKRETARLRRACNALEQARHPDLTEVI